MREPTIGQRIKAWRKHRGRTQVWVRKQMAKLPKRTRPSHVPGSALICYWEYDKRRPKEEHVRAIATVLGLTMAEFYGPLPSSEA